LFAKVLWIVEQPGDIFGQSRFALSVANSALEGIRCLEREEFDAVLASFPLPDWTSPTAFLEELQRVQPSAPVVIHFPAAEVADVVKLMHQGAFHVYQNGDPSSVLSLAARSKELRAAAETAPAEAAPWRSLLVGDSPALRQIAETIRLVAPRRSTILITGETGTGKEVLARAVHQAGARARLPMICVNCSALPEALLEAELFGHVKGAFTGAVGQRVGRFEQAHRGTLFLDEIGDMPLSLQAKLLRVLQEREFQRLGSSETVRVDVRVIAATNADLAAKIKEGKFRDDLYYRLNVVPIAIPPLRERNADIPLLAYHFLLKICRGENLAPKQLTREALVRLASHDWPGNVRQLENAIEKAVILSGERTILYPGDFPLPRRTHPVPINEGTPSMIAVPDHGLDFERIVENIERNLLEQALKKTHGNKKMAAEMLGLKRTTLSAKLKSLAAVAVAG